MAIPNNYIDKITDHDSGESRPICPPAEHVQVDNENFEGDTLDEVLDEVAQAIEEAGQGGYAPPQGGIPKTDLAQSVQDSLDKADSALQDEDVAEVAKTGDYNDLENKPTIPDTSGLATKTELNAKQDKLQAGNGITIAQDGKTVSVDASIRTGAGKGATAVQSVSVDSEEDGTVDIHVDDDTYTINLNHTHEGMAKLEKHTPATMPDVSEMESDTIYAEIEDGEVNVLYVGGVPFYGGGGGGTSTPVLRQPADGSTIDVGTIESGESSVTKTITIKGKSLTQALTVAVTGTGYSVDKQSIPAADANVGTTLTITCTNTNGISAGTLSIASSEVSCDCDLVVYEDLRAVKLTGSQWLQTDYYPNTNTEFTMECKLTPNANTSIITSVGGYVLRCNYDTSTSEAFTLHIGRKSTEDANGAYQIFLQIKSGTGNRRVLYFGDNDRRNEFIADHAIISYTKGSSYGTFGFNGGTPRTVQSPLADTNLTSPMMIGKRIDTEPFGIFDLTIYRLSITENGQAVRDWVPKMKDGTIPGLYDEVAGKFISSETAKTSGLASDELVAIPL